MRKPFIIGFTGKKRAGKSTAAEYVMAYLKHAREFSFAEPIKHMTRAMGIDDRKEPYLSNKEAVIPPLGVPLRFLWQTLGTEWGRNMINPNLWVILAQIRLEAYQGPYAIFTDVRFNNEAKWIKDNGGVIIHIERPEPNDQRPWYKRWLPKDKHKSEAGIRKEFIDYYVMNDEELVDLYDDIEAIMTEIGL